MIRLSEHYIQDLMGKGLRIGGRALDEYRPITIEKGVSSKSAEGSAMVSIGGTKVVAGVKMEVAKPYPDKPDEGSIMVNAELIPLSSPEFEPGPPGIDSIEISRVVDRALRESGAIDFKKLCIIPREKMWIIIVDIYPLNNEGNLFDAAFLAALAAIQDAYFPKYDEKTETIDYKERTKKRLPLVKTPMSCTIWKIRHRFLADPLEEEEAAASARLTVAMADEKTICALQKGKDGPLTLEEIDAAINLAVAKIKELWGHFT